MAQVVKDCSLVTKIIPTATMTITDPIIPKIVILYKIILRNKFSFKYTCMYAKLIMDEISTNIFDANNAYPAAVSYNSSFIKSALFVP